MGADGETTDRPYLASDADWQLARARVVAYLRYKAGETDELAAGVGRKVIIEELLAAEFDDTILFVETMAHLTISLFGTMLGADDEQVAQALRELTGPNWDEVFSVLPEDCARQLDAQPSELASELSSELGDG